MKELTPAMRQYAEMKERYPDCILFFRMGDFYEMFFEDALTAAKILEIALTSRNKNSKDAIPLCGFPYHAASSYIAKLIKKGFKVAICEQIEDPKLAKGVVRRDVVRVVTPGLVLDTENLRAKENNFLAALSVRNGRFGLASVDISTGEFLVTEADDREFFLAETAGMEIRELLVEEDFSDEELVRAIAGEGERCRIGRFVQEGVTPEKAGILLREHIPQERLAELAIESRPAAAVAAGAVIAYMAETQKDALLHINTLMWYESGAHLIVDEIAKRNLELFETIAEGKKTGSLFHVLDQTVTSMGGRRLRRWLNYPLRDPVTIRERLSAVSEIREKHLLRESLRTRLRSVYDLERLGSRIAMGLANGRDLASLGTSLLALPEILLLLKESETPLMKTIRDGIDPLTDITELIESAIVADPPLTIREGGIIREGYDPELDSLIVVMRDGRQWIAALEEKERRRTGINSLKVGFNSVFGYYFEITKANARLIPPDYIRKQTLVNAERYINEELKGYEETVLHAEERRQAREYDLFIEIRGRIAGEIRRIQETASRIADLDALASLAEVAERYNYCCPGVDAGETIEIVDGRHPVVERMAGGTGFVPNDVLLDLEKNRFLIITGPNMAGKSTYIRQIALIVLMAQMGSFVPAAKARVGLVDRIFTRIGAADSIARGQSTFMVEMTEVANILRHATKRSLVILDEVGRGTSTFDGLSIAWAVAEYIHDADPLGARTLFATHYHELTELAVTKEGVRNFNIAVREWGDRIIFLRKIMEGGTNRSYGIQVARIAGVPGEVVARAMEILRNMEQGELDEVGMPKIARGKKTTQKNANQLSLFADQKEAIMEELKALDLLNLTPLDAIGRLGAWKERLGQGGLLGKT
ncbi:MAG: DNA mismatch repair protein MutS [Deltaproteobacteria bacterium]|nr:DNA mismatch repair protein MutS [Deltaproteobacteria bacterium]